MPSTALVDFKRRLTSIDHTRRRMESLFASQRVARRDVHSVYEALFMRAVTGFEAFLEQFFFDVMEGRVRLPRRHVAVKVRVAAGESLREIILQGDKYLDWIPYVKTLERAELYLKKGAPFACLNDADRSTVKRITTIRHAIAHTGHHAITEFKRTVIGNMALLRGEKTPAGFLRSRTNPATTRFEVYVGELARIAQKICDRDDPTPP